MSNIHSHMEVSFNTYCNTVQFSKETFFSFSISVLKSTSNCQRPNSLEWCFCHSRHTCVCIGRGPVRRLQVYTSVQCRQRAHGTDPCRVLMRCWLGLSCKLWCNATKKIPRDVTSSKYENVSTCCKLWVNTEDITSGYSLYLPPH